MDPQSIAELADSIKAQGLIQPILVRPVENGKYEIIAGERRWRASQLAGLTQVPVVVRTVADKAALSMASSDPPSTSPGLKASSFSRERRT